MLREERVIKNALEWAEAYIKVHGPGMSEVERAKLIGKKEGLEWVLRLRGR